MDQKDIILLRCNFYSYFYSVYIFNIISVRTSESFLVEIDKLILKLHCKEGIYKSQTNNLLKVNSGNQEGNGLESGRSTHKERLGDYKSKVEGLFYLFILFFWLCWVFGSCEGFLQRAYFKSRVIKTVWYWHKNKHTE